MTTHVIPISGGVDSAWCLVKSATLGQNPRTIFFDYGQPYMKEEHQTVFHGAVSEFIRGNELQPTMMSTMDRLAAQKGGVFDGRNERFIIEILSKFAGDITIHLGIRGLLACMDQYGDTNLQWAYRMEKKYKVKLHLPCLLRPDFWIRKRLAQYGMAPNLLYSSKGYHYAIQGAEAN